MSKLNKTNGSTFPYASQERDLSVSIKQTVLPFQTLKSLSSACLNFTSLTLACPLRPTFKCAQYNCTRQVAQDLKAFRANYHDSHMRAAWTPPGPQGLTGCGVSSRIDRLCVPSHVDSKHFKKRPSPSKPKRPCPSERPSPGKPLLLPVKKRLNMTTNIRSHPCSNFTTSRRYHHLHHLTRPQSSKTNCLANLPDHMCSETGIALAALLQIFPGNKLPKYPKGRKGQTPKRP
jgi:hypothetical protein